MHRRGRRSSAGNGGIGRIGRIGGSSSREAPVVSLGVFVRDSSQEVDEAVHIGGLGRIDRLGHHGQGLPLPYWRRSIDGCSGGATNTESNKENTCYENSYFHFLKYFFLVFYASY
jgi:hypothetical protein